ncbi:hypothetical protein [Xanthomonas sp. XNM01]|uniref:hypothetical protein n=1 Tax=Xanthomonas sp. XNM01 TaxID=2769289 RepID=UPI001783F6E2|nr:hypothetical protein [Xanthomonas sp. XNM01]MBD9367291.1 hypothetical protein [Xanthomonas sp. XNM01]
MLAVLLPALPLLASCQTAEPLGRVVTPAQVLPTDPPLNPDPKHVIRLYGRAPASLDFRFRVVFTTTNQEGDCWNHAGFWDGGGALGWAYEFHPVRNGDAWEADFVVDRYLPGECGWDISASAHIIVQPKEAGDASAFVREMDAVVADGRDFDERAPRCRSEYPRCSESRMRILSNADPDVPVQVRCRRLSLGQRIGNSSFRCNHMPQHKTMHWIISGTESVRIDIYDIEIEEPMS